MSTGIIIMCITFFVLCLFIILCFFGYLSNTDEIDDLKSSYRNLRISISTLDGYDREISNLKESCDRLATYIQPLSIARKELDRNTNAIRGLQNEIDLIREITSDYYKDNRSGDFVFVKAPRKGGKL